MTEEKTLLPHQIRVVMEADELEERIEKLRAFMTAKSFWKIEPDERVSLAKQLSAMKDYLHVLRERIARF